VKFGLQWAEAYYFMIDIPYDNHLPDALSPVEEYFKKNALPI
jgi:hypothetical protein